MTVVQRSLGFSCNNIHRAFVYLVFYRSEEDVERLSCYFLIDQRDMNKTRILVKTEVPNVWVPFGGGGAEVLLLGGWGWRGE